MSCRGCWTFGALCRGQIDPIFYLRPPVVLGVVGSNLKRKNGEKINNEYIINMNETNTRKKTLYDDEDKQGAWRINVDRVWIRVEMYTSV